MTRAELIDPDDVQTKIAWLTVTADFLERGHWPIETKAVETFLNGLRDAASTLTDLSVEIAALKAQEKVGGQEEGK